MSAEEVMLEPFLNTAAEREHAQQAREAADAERLAVRWEAAEQGAHCSWAEEEAPHRLRSWLEVLLVLVRVWALKGGYNSTGQAGDDH